MRDDIHAELGGNSPHPEALNSTTDASGVGIPFLPLTLS
jgi:hypothetical protein